MPPSQRVENGKGLNVSVEKLSWSHPKMYSPTGPNRPNGMKQSNYCDLVPQGTSLLYWSSTI